MQICYQSAIKGDSCRMLVKLEQLVEAVGHEVTGRHFPQVVSHAPQQAGTIVVGVQP